MGKVWSDPGQSLRPEFVTFSSSINYSQIFPVVRVTGHQWNGLALWTAPSTSVFYVVGSEPSSSSTRTGLCPRGTTAILTSISQSIETLRDSILCASNWKATFESQDRSVLQDWRGLVWIVKVENMDPERCHLPARRSDVVLKDWTSFSHFAAYLLSKLGLLTP